jgi:hypothetical protein
MNTPLLIEARPACQSIADDPLVLLLMGSGTRDFRQTDRDGVYRRARVTPNRCDVMESVANPVGRTRIGGRAAVMSGAWTDLDPRRSPGRSCGASRIAAAWIPLAGAARDRRFYRCLTSTSAHISVAHRRYYSLKPIATNPVPRDNRHHTVLGRHGRGGGGPHAARILRFQRGPRDTNS